MAEARAADAARLGDVTLQIVRDWVLRFNANAPDGLIDGKVPGPKSRLNDAQRTALGADGRAQERRRTAGGAQQVLRSHAGAAFGDPGVCGGGARLTFPGRASLDRRSGWPGKAQPAISWSTT